MRCSLAVWLCLVTLACSSNAGKSDTADAADTDSAATPPAPQVFSPPATTFDSSVAWTRITELLHDETSRVRTVMESRQRGVTVTMKDGRVYRSVEPQLGGVVRLVHEVDQSGAIMVGTE